MVIGDDTTGFRDDSTQFGGRREAPGARCHVDGRNRGLHNLWHKRGRAVGFCQKFWSKREDSRAGPVCGRGLPLFSRNVSVRAPMTS